MKTSIPLIVSALLFMTPALAADLDKPKLEFCKTYLIMPADLDLPDEQLDKRLEQSQQAVLQRYQHIERSLPDKVKPNNEQTPRLTKKDIRNQYRTWKAYQEQYCSNEVKRYDLNRNAENHAWAVCMLNLSQMQLCVMQDF